MKLNELTNDSQLQLEFTTGSEKLYIDVQIAQVSRSGLVLYPVLYDGKTLSFKDNHNIVNIVLLQSNGKPLIWKNVTVSNAVVNGNPYVLVRSLDDSMEYNRRRNYRLDLDMQGNILGVGEVIIHDISNGGISFYLDKHRSCQVGQTVNIGFSSRGDNYTVKATIRRIVEEEERCLYGCTMSSTPMIDAFIIAEQRYRIKGY